MTKWAPPVYEPPMSPQEIGRLNERRRWEHGVADMGNGFTLRSSGRDGYVYYRDGGRLIEFYWEMSGNPSYDIIMNLSALGSWIQPVPEPIDEAKRRAIETDLRSWLGQQGLRALFTC